MRKQGVALKDGIDVAVFRRDMGDIVIFEMDPSAVDVFQAGNKAQNGGFTAARGAKQSEKLTIVDGQVKVVDDRFTISCEFPPDAPAANANAVVYSIFDSVPCRRNSKFPAAAGFVINHLWGCTFLIRASILRQTRVIANP